MRGRLVFGFGFWLGVGVLLEAGSERQRGYTHEKKT